MLRQSGRSVRNIIRSQRGPGFCSERRCDTAVVQFFRNFARFRTIADGIFSAPNPLQFGLLLKWLIMNKCRIYRGNWSVVICGMLFLFLLRSAMATEETFPTLQVGSHVYTNVTVTTKAKNYIFIHHSTGMENIRVADLPDELRSELGYIPELSKKEKAAAWAKSKLGDLNIGEINAATLQDPNKWRETAAIVFEKARAIDNKLCGAIMGGVLLIYLFFCYCCLLICQKAGREPGLLIWIPFLQSIPLLRAARMSAAWFVASILIVPGMIGGIIWSFKIAKARGKSAVTGFLMLIPVLGVLPFFYLAFADNVPTAAVKEDRRTEHLMTLEVA
jgi:hypothetical protein